MPSASELERQAQEEAIENSPHERPANAPDAAVTLTDLEERAKKLGFENLTGLVEWYESRRIQPPQEPKPRDRS